MTGRGPGAEPTLLIINVNAAASVPLSSTFTNAFYLISEINVAPDVVIFGFDAD
jgi:hypothetical protein